MTLARGAVPWFRLCVVLPFLGYLFAGAGLALPPSPHCARCATINKASTMKPGAACPLSHQGHHCHRDQQRTAAKIVLCPDGCLRHNDLGGEIPTPAKFLSTLAGLFVRLPVLSVPSEPRLDPSDVVIPPPHHPPPPFL